MWSFRHQHWPVVDPTTTIEVGKYCFLHNHGNRSSTIYRRVPQTALHTPGLWTAFEQLNTDRLWIERDKERSHCTNAQWRKLARWPCSRIIEHTVHTLTNSHDLICWTNVVDAGPTLYKCYANVLCLLGKHWCKMYIQLLLLLLWSPCTSNYLNNINLSRRAETNATFYTKQHTKIGGTLSGYFVIHASFPAVGVLVKNRKLISLWKIFRYLTVKQLLFRSAPNKNSMTLYIKRLSSDSWNRLQKANSYFHQTRWNTYVWRRNNTHCVSFVPSD